jgi:kanamycin kinase
MSEKPVPGPVAAVAADRPAREVWENMLGGRTFEVGSGPGRCFVKWTPASSGISLADEAARMAWAGAFTPVPRVIGQGADEAGSWLVTSALPGQNAVMPRWQGDACAPNTLITEDGRWSGHVDLGDLGVADRWADLAIATWSAEWNYGPGWERPLLDAYGIRADPDRTRYYRLLWDLDP